MKVLYKNKIMVSIYKNYLKVLFQIEELETVSLPPFKLLHYPQKKSEVKTPPF
jgi:hypothetical protein